MLSWEGAPTAPSTAPQAVLCAGGTQQPSSALPDVPPATHEVSPHSGDPCSPPHAHSTAQPWAAVTWSSCTLCPTAGLLCGHRKLRVTPHSLSTLCSAAPGVGWEGCGRAQSSAVGWGCPGTAVPQPPVGPHHETPSLGAAAHPLQPQQSLRGKLSVCITERRPRTRLLCTLWVPRSSV